MTKTKTNRDPRVNPRPFDIVQSAKGTSRKVVYVTLMDQVIYDPVKNGRTGAQRVCELKTWRTWAKKGKVLDQYENEITHSDYAIQTNYHISGQLTLIGNEIMNDANRKSSPDVAISCTPNSEVAQVLFELGLAAYFADHRFKRRVDAEVEKRASK